MADTRDCALIRDELAALTEGEPSAALREHLAACDDCRDLRHEARAAREAVALAGADYAPPPELEARLLAALDARSSAPGGTTAPALPPAPDARAAKAVAPPAAPVQRNRRRLYAGVGLGIAAAASIVGALALRDDDAGDTAERDGKPPVIAAARAPWQGRVAFVSRAAADPTGGLEVRAAGANAFTPLASGALVPMGAALRTDPRTRARIDLADGTRVVLDRGTELRLEPSRSRTARLVAGALVADVAHVDGAEPALFSLPNGAVTVLGTKFALTAADGRSTVRVTRGEVRLTDAAMRVAEVKTGMEGVLAVNAPPEVSPAVDLAGAVAWSELGPEVRVEPDAPVLGLGELRARRPGQSVERDHAVTLASHTVRVRIAGNIARTEIDETFRNDTADELEGIYRFPLPPEAQVETLALDVRGQMEEGVFVDKQRASAIWAGVLRNAVHPMQHAQETQELVWVPGPWHDPALLEWQRGGRFELRVFPIPAHGQRRVEIAYTQVIPASAGVRRYVYPLAHDANGSTRVEQFDVDAQVLGHDPALGVRARGYALTAQPGEPGAARLAFAQSAFVPAGDLVLEYALPHREQPVTAWAFQPPAATAPVSARAPAPPPNRAVLTPPAPAPVESAYVALALRPQLPRWTDPRPRDYALVVDASRSMVGERLLRAARLARAMVTEMDPRDRVTVLACDTTCRAMPGGLLAAGGTAARAVESFLAQEEPAGASDLVAQVRAAVSALGSAGDRDARVVYLGDGAATVGYRRADSVAAELATVLPSGRATLTAVAIGGDADTTLLGAMAHAGGGVVVPYVPGEALGAAALAALEATYGITLRNPTLTLPSGLTESSPAQLPSIRAGGEALVVARMGAREVTGEAVLRGTVGGEPFEARFPLSVHASEAAGNAFVPRLYAATRIAELEATPGDGGRAEASQLSTRFRVPSRYTSLLVLESEAMYRAFGVRHDADGRVRWTGETAAETTAVDTLTPGALTDTALETLRAVRETDVQTREPAEQQQAARLGGAGLAAAAPSAEQFAADDMADTASAGDAERMSLGALAPAETSANASGPALSGIGYGGGGRGHFAAPRAAMPAPGAAPPASPPAGRSRSAMATAPTLQTVVDRSLNVPPRGGQWMRRVWVRHGAVGADPLATSGELAHVAAARAALQAMPDSKTRHQELYRWLALAGLLDEANDIATRWSTRDALDPDALVRLADTAARRGARDRAVRVLAGTVDVRPEDPSALRRMALLHERAGETERACAYRVSLAQLRPADADEVSSAVRCERVLGHTAGAERLLAAVPTESARQRATALAASAPPGLSAATSASGELVLAARWDVPTDLDVAVIDPRGNRVSWLGGRASGLTAVDVRGTRDESLGVPRVGAGEYVIELSRATAGGSAVRGQLEVTVLGVRRVVPFAIAPGESTHRVARVVVTRESQLVPM